MGVLKYVKTCIGKLNKLSLSIFYSFHNDIKNLRKKNKTVSNDVGTYQYDIKDIFDVIINSCKDNATLRDSIDKNSNFNDTYISTPNYWLCKVYGLNTFDDMYYKIYKFANSIRKSLYISKNNPLYHLYKKYNIFAGDGTICKCSFRNEHGKNIASYTISIILNTMNNLIYDYRLCFNNNELSGILNAKLTLSDIIVLDRGYSKLSLMDKLSKRTNFVIRLTRNLMIYKNFIKSGKDCMIINRNGYRIKLIRYYVDKETRIIIKDKYGDNNSEDNDPFFVIVTNLTDLTFDEMCELYKKRWEVEVCNKNIKSNFNIRHIVKQSNSSKPINKITFYVSLSIMLYNIITLEKKLSEMKYYYQTQKRIEYNFSQHVTLYKQYIKDNINHCDKKIKMTVDRKEHRINVNKRQIKKKKQSSNNKKKGKYKSLEKMAKLNGRNDIIDQINTYYKKVKKLDNLRGVT